MSSATGSRLLGSFIVLMMLAGGVEAHRLQLFATVEGGVVHGYGFFAGGARARESRLVIRDSNGTELFAGSTGADGAFSFRPPHPADLDLSVDAGDGHVARAHIAASRFSSGAAGTNTRTAREDAPGCGGALPDNLSSVIDSTVDRAVARQVSPLLEAYAAAESRVRFHDIVSGIAIIIGLGGAFLWGRSRRGRKNRSDRDKP